MNDQPYVVTSTDEFECHGNVIVDDLKDAARYRWLRSAEGSDAAVVSGMLPSGQALDDLVDAAMTAARQY